MRPVNGYCIATCHNGIHDFIEVPKVLEEIIIADYLKITLEEFRDKQKGINI